MAASASGVAFTGFLRSAPPEGLGASVDAATAAGGAGAGAAALSLPFSCCCAVEMLKPVKSTTPTQTNPWRITNSWLRNCMFSHDERIASQPTQLASYADFSPAKRASTKGIFALHRAL